MFVQLQKSRQVDVQLCFALPAPSGREANTTYEAEFIQLVHESHSQMMQQIVENEKQRQRAEKVAKIEYYLRGSPLSGYGPLMVSEGERTGVNPYLCAAVATAESSNAWAEPSGSFNAWGMGPGMTFSSRRAAITFWFDNCIRHWGPVQSAYEMAGYCVGDHPWMENVQGIVDAIERIE